MENAVVMSREELKIRNELEMDVERDLEEEIKDEIYHLALRLHRLYQHQKEKRGRELSYDTNVQQGLKKKTLSEVNINIRMEGGTKIEIKETKKEGRDENGLPRTFRSEDTQEKIVAPSRKKFDWAQTLRAGPNPIIKKVDSPPHQAKMLKKDLHVNENVKVEGPGKSIVGALGQRKENISIKRERRELGWKD